MVSNRPSPSSAKPRVPTWVLLWVAVLLLGAVLFFSNQAWVTGLLGGLGMDADGPPPVLVQPETVDVSVEPPPDQAPVISQNGFSADLQPLLDAIAADQVAADSPSPIPSPAEGRLQTLPLFFVVPQSDGAIDLVETKREIAVGTSPLTMALHSLLAGPTAEELSRNILSLIPYGTQLLGARVAGETATLNFSDAFQFNTLGIEGYQAQLKQVVFTATAFPTIEKVQILIEGHRVSSLGGGVPIGVPLNRASFDR